MADRNLSELIRFLDPSGSMTDADIAEVSRKLKFTDGELMESVYEPHDVDNTSASGSVSDYLDSDGGEVEEVVAYWKGDGYTPEPDNDDYEG